MAQGYEPDCFAPGNIAQDDMVQIEENIVALHSCQSGTSAPSNTAGGALWLDTTNHQLKIRNEANDAWVTLLTFNTTLDIVNFLSAGVVDNANATAITISSSEIVTFSNDPIIPDEAYGSGWNGSLEPPTKNAIYDKLEVTNASMQFLEQQTCSTDASIVFTSDLDSTYDEYEFHFVNVVPSSDGAFLRMRTSDDGGTTYDDGASAYFSKEVSDSKIKLSDAVGSGGADEMGISGVVTLYDPASGYPRVMVHTIYDGTASGVTLNWDNAGKRRNAAAVDAVQFTYNSGSLESGNIKLYGIKKS